MRDRTDLKKLRSIGGLVFVAVVAVALLPGFGCTSRDQSLVRLVPLESCAVMTIDWSSIRANGELRRLINGNGLEALMQQLRINSESVNRVTVFSSVNSERNSGLLFRGAFAWKSVVTALKDSGWREDSLEGHQVYVNGQEYVSMPVGNTLFAGTREGALAVFRAADDSQESILASEAYKKINTVLSTKSKPVKAFLLIPQGTLDMADAALTATSVALSLFNLGGVGQLLQAVNVARGFALSVDSGTHEKYPVELCVLMRDEDSATFVSGSLEAMKTISELASMDKRDRESLEAFRQMTIVRKREVLAVKMEIPGNALFPPPGH